ncbi:hypothetical protein K2173_025065 [Erythroxylum novogranatense]|uniref:Plastid lipid-associated protein/fibrillin conserved domain-containing protein n=1 Tax=Erythroxylum novogranatense TaxID=1862640 RepID=A0AAV8SVL2_9ROSI|nr:hypothetical protein K2173_025065 [Erythroxylum novogranatense]
MSGTILPGFCLLYSHDTLKTQSIEFCFVCIQMAASNSACMLPEIGWKKSDGSACSRRMMSIALQPGSPDFYSREIQRLSAKRSLLLAFKDSGGFAALVTGQTTDIQRIEVNERIIGLERLNPTPRPTTSPFLEGRWDFQWFGSAGSGLFAPTFTFQGFPSNLASLSKLDVVIKDGIAKVTTYLKLLFSIESKFVLSSRLTVEGPLRMKAEYAQGVLETPTVIKETLPEELKGAFILLANTMQQLPVPVRDAISSGVKVPLLGNLQRLFVISYLDEEILIIRDTAGVPEVLTKLDAPASPPA